MQLAPHAFRFLLIFGMLLSGVPAWQHSHDAGDRPHRHAHDGHAHDGHAHDGHSQGSRSEDGCDGVSQSHAHVHFALFGLEFTIPVESDDDDSWHGQTTYLAAAATVMEFAPTSSYFAALAQPMLKADERVQVVLTFRSISAPAAPLSDNARHERTGVLLI